MTRGIPVLDPARDLVGATPETLVKALFRRTEPLRPETRTRRKAVTQWGDGDLDYEIQVRSNGFHRILGSGSDTGRIEGVFVGREHERIMGIVDRLDMSAGFGGTRQ